MPRLVYKVVVLLCVCFVFGRCVERGPVAKPNASETMIVPEVVPEPDPAPTPEVVSESATAPEPVHSTAPSGRAAMLVISKETMTLTVLDADSAAIARYPVAVGINPGNKRRSGDHKTPEGRFTVENIQDASRWTHDFGDGKGEIEGAYGSHFIRLSTPPHKGIGIHGTHAPESIGSRASEGCIRLRNDHLLELVPLVRKGLPVVIVPGVEDVAVNEGV